MRSQYLQKEDEMKKKKKTQEKGFMLQKMVFENVTKQKKCKVANIFKLTEIKCFFPFPPKQFWIRL